MKQILFFTAALIALIPTVSGGQVLPFTHYSPDNELNPLPSAEVHKVYQDRQGYMWFAVYSSGVVRYNGVSLEIYGLEDGLNDLTVWDMIEGPAGRLWVSSNGGVVVSEKPLNNYEAGERIQFTRQIQGTELINVAVNHNRMAADLKGSLWVGTESLGLVRYKYTADGIFESDTLSTSINESENELAVRSVTVRMDGSVWVALLDGYLLKYDDTVSQIYNTGTQSITNTLYESPDGTLWGGERSGRVWRLNETGGKNEFIYIQTNSNSNIPDITTTSDGSLWISSEGSGIQIIDPVLGEQIGAYTRANGLLGEIVFNVFEDQENNIWIAQSGGVSKLRYNYKAFRNLTATSLAGENPVLPSPSVNSVLPSSNPSIPCNIWAGTSEGGLACINDDFSSDYIQLEDGLTGNWVNGLAYDQTGRLWVGTARGLNSISFGDIPPPDAVSASNEISVFGAPALLATYPAASILAVEKLMIKEHPDTDSYIESIWFPAYQSVYAFVNGQLYTLDSTTGLPVAIFHTVAFDGNGHLWVGTRDKGIYRSIEPFTLETLIQNEISDRPNILFEPWWSTENGAPSNQIENMVWQSGSMWVGTQTGLAILENGTRNLKKLITTRDGLRANNAISFALSPVNGMLWVGTNQGLAELDPVTGTVLRTVTRTDGLIDNEVWFYGSVQFDTDGILYFGTAKGISLYNPEADRINTVPPTLKLTNFTANDIRGERNEFLFEYAALSFGNERQVQYQTRLIGFNDEWSDRKYDTRVNYTNLSAIFLPRSYTFEVRAINESGIGSTAPLSFDFSVNPPLMLRWWAFLIYLVVLGTGIYGVDRFQRSRLIKRERQAAYLREAELKAETAIAKSNAAESQAKALQAENDLKAAELEKARELEIAYHELKSTQSRLIQAEKMASLGRLSTGIAHEIKNPLNFINNFSEVSRELVDELKAAIALNDEEEIEYILKNLTFNTQKIDEHGKRADSIVKSMMQHSRGGQGEFENSDLNQIIQKFIELAYQGKKSQLSGLDIIIHTELDPSLLPVYIIPQKIGQVLQNILENAIDSVWTYRVSQNGEFKPQIYIKSRSTNTHVEITISDNGPGIPEAIREKIFEPFFTTKPTGEGTGLGLSLSYDFITQIHNGKLELGESDLGGAAFIISLPLMNNHVNT
jgi:signal transduction histidine kinase/ligand-binding sensor domain-containing protein